MKILLATDGSTYSKAAVEEIAGRSFMPDTEVRIISVYSTSSLIMSARLSMGVDSAYYTELNVAARQSAEDAVNEAAKTLNEKNPGLLVSTMVTSGSPKEAILEEAEKFNADLIVAGSQGKGAISRFLLGSVSQALVLHASCSVEIVRKKENAKVT